MRLFILLEVALLAVPLGVTALSPTPTPFWGQAPMVVMENYGLETPTPTPISSPVSIAIVTTQTPALVLAASPSPSLSPTESLTPSPSRTETPSPTATDCPSMTPLTCWDDSVIPPNGSVGIPTTVEIHGAFLRNDSVSCSNPDGQVEVVELTPLSDGGYLAEGLRYATRYTIDRSYLYQWCGETYTHGCYTTFFTEDEPAPTPTYTPCPSPSTPPCDSYRTVPEDRSTGNLINLDITSPYIITKISGNGIDEAEIIPMDDDGHWFRVENLQYSSCYTISLLNKVPWCHDEYAYNSCSSEFCTMDPPSPTPSLTPSPTPVPGNSWILAQHQSETMEHLVDLLEMLFTPQKTSSNSQTSTSSPAPWCLR